MKPSLLFVQTENPEIDTQIEKFCEIFCNTHHVYLVRPGSEFRSDSPNGLRILNNSIDNLPGFSDVETVICVADTATVELLGETYPLANLEVWDTDDDWHLPDLLFSVLRPTIVQGDFGSTDGQKFACAM